MEGTVVAVYLQYGAIGAMVVIMAFISYTLWRALITLVTANMKSIELTERVTICMERMTESMVGLTKAQAESTRVLIEKIDLVGQVQKMAADILVMKGKG